MKYTMIDDRIYKVVACWRCPFHLCSIDDCYCNHPEEYRRHRIDITKTFPDWCPLKEVEEKLDIRTMAETLEVPRVV